MEKKTTKKVATKKPLTKKKESLIIKDTITETPKKGSISVVLMTAQTEYPFEGNDLQVLFGFEPKKITGKTFITLNKNGQTYSKQIKPMMLKKYLNNRHFLTVLEKQITSLLK